MTAGHTGAGVAAAILHLRRAPGVDRPALAVQMVTETGPFVLLDIGATTELDRRACSTSTPRWARSSPSRSWASRTRGSRLLSIGEENGKGDARIQRATELLEASDLNFIGNVEGKDLVVHMADVVVCDAVVGNVVIKFFEGLSRFIFGLLRKEFERKPFGPPAYLLMRPGIRRIRRIFDYELSRRLAAPGRQRHGDHHPRPGQAADDLVRRGRRRRGRPGRDPRGDRPDLRARAARWVGHAPARGAPEAPAAEAVEAAQ